MLSTAFSLRLKIRDKIGNARFQKKNENSEFVCLFVCLFVFLVFPKPVTL